MCEIQGMLNRFESVNRFLQKIQQIGGLSYVFVFSWNVSYGYCMVEVSNQTSKEVAEVAL